MKTLPEEFTPKWTRCSDEMPEVGEVVLVYVDDWKHGDGWCYDLAALSDLGNFIGHRVYKPDECAGWMRLPSPPPVPPSVRQG